MSTILFITDLSEQSQNAFNYVLHFADRIRAKIVLLNCPAGEIEKKAHSEMLQENTQRIYALRMLAAEFAFKYNCQIVTDYLIEDELLESCFYSIEKKIKPDFCLICLDFNQDVQKNYYNLVYKFIPHVISPFILIPGHVEFLEWQGIAFLDQQKNKEPLRLKQVLLLSHLFNSKLFCFNINIQDKEVTTPNKKELLIQEAIKNNKLIHIECNHLVDKLQQLVKQNEIQSVCISNESLHYEKVLESYLQNGSDMLSLPIIIYQDRL